MYHSAPPRPGSPGPRHRGRRPVRTQVRTRIRTRVRTHRRRNRWPALLVPLAIAAAVLTGGVATAGVQSFHGHFASGVRVLSVAAESAAAGQPVTASATVSAARYSTLSEVTIAVRAPDGSRVDFPHARRWWVGTTPKVFSGTRTFAATGTYTYWFAYQRHGHWVDVSPRRTFTVGAAGTPSPAPSTPEATAPATPTPSGNPTTAPSPPATAPTGPASPGTHGCAGNPGSCGYPTTATAGVPAGTALSVVNGGTTVTTSGTVIAGKEIHGCVDVRAADVTIRDTRIIGPCAYGVSTYSAGGTTTLDHVEITCVDGRGTGIAGPGFTAHAVYVHDCENGLEINNNSSLTDSVISAREGTSTAHGDGIQSQGGTNVVIRHNTLLEINPVTSAIITNPTKNHDWLVEQNLMGGGAYTIYCPEQGTGFVVRDNRFVPAKAGSLYSAAFGLTDACNHAGITWTGNFLDTDGSRVGP